MSWTLVIWSMLASACLTLAVVHLTIWIGNRSALPSLLFSMMSLSTAAMVLAEAWMMQSRTIEDVAEALRWMHVPIWMLLVSMIGFVHVYLDAGRWWLALAAIGARTLALVLNFTTGININFLEITRLERVLFLGDPVSVVSGIVNPLMVIPQLGLLLCLAFIADASVTAWRRGERSKAVWIGGTSVLFILAGAVQALLIVVGGLKTPTTNSLFFLGIVVAMAHASGRYLQGAQRLAEDLGEAERRMLLAVDAAKVGIWSRDMVNGVTWANAQWRELFGFAPRETVTSQAVLAKVHPDDRDRLSRIMVDTPGELGSRGVYHIEFRIVLPDGSVRWVASQGHAEFDSRGRQIRTRGATIDCTARKTAEQETQLLREEIAHVGRVSVLGQLASSLAHEINQPLGAILRNAEAAALYLQQDEPDLDEIRAIVQDIRKDDQRAGQVLDRIRLLLRRQDIQMQPLRLQDLFADVAALLRTEALSRRVRLSLDIAPDMPLVSGDRIHLQQVLLNLVSNGMDAIDEAGRGSRSIVMSARRDSARSVVIEVRDSGRGFGSTAVEQMFEPFFTTKSKGMGMGLSISRTIVEAHCGRLWGENNVDGGARFLFTVPVA